VSAARPFRFGVVGKVAQDAAAWRALARQAEDLGYATLLVSDHLDVQFAPIPATLAAADATQRLRVGTLVANLDLRDPLLLGRDACTVDVLTDGRFELGVGAGWLPDDYALANRPMPDGPVRALRFAEAVTVLTRVFGRAAGPYHGEFHTVGQIEPGPMRPGGYGPRLLVGAGGTRMLRTAARFADTVGLSRDFSRADAREQMLRPAFRAKYDVLRRAAGDRWADIEISVFATNVKVGPAGTDAVRELARRKEIDVAAAIGAPEHLLGEPAAIVERLRADRDELGVSYVTVPAACLREFAPVVDQLADR
jgi:probable F420-dependent oxidoreductase